MDKQLIVDWEWVVMIVWVEGEVCNIKLIIDVKNVVLVEIVQV